MCWIISNASRRLDRGGEVLSEARRGMQRCEAVSWTMYMPAAAARESVSPLWCEVDQSISHGILGSPSGVDVCLWGPRDGSPIRNDQQFVVWMESTSGGNMLPKYNSIWPKQNIYDLVTDSGFAFSVICPRERACLSLSCAKFLTVRRHLESQQNEYQGIDRICVAQNNRCHRHSTGICTIATLRHPHVDIPARCLIKVP